MRSGAVVHQFHCKTITERALPLSFLLLLLLLHPWYAREIAGMKWLRVSYQVPV